MECVPWKNKFPKLLDFCWTMAQVLPIISTTSLEIEDIYDPQTFVSTIDLKYQNFLNQCEILFAPLPEEEVEKFKLHVEAITNDEKSTMVHVMVLYKLLQIIREKAQTEQRKAARLQQKRQGVGDMKTGLSDIAGLEKRQGEARKVTELGVDPNSFMD